MNQLIINEKCISGDRKISIAIMSSFAILTIQYLILITFNLIDTTVGTSIQLTSKALVGVFYLIALPSVWRRNKIKFICVYFISIFFFILNALIFRENWIYLRSIIFPYFFTCLPSFIYSYSINDWTVLKNVMKKTSLLSFIVCLILAILVFTGRASVGTYSMSLSYYMLLPTIIFLDEFLDRFNVVSFVITLTSIIIIIINGARGPVMCVGVFFILKLFNMRHKLTYKNLLIYIIIITIILTCSFFFDYLIENLNDLFLQFGIRSRTLSLFLRDNLHLSGRDHLYKAMIQSISDNPVSGIGLAGDRRVIGRYSHNIVIEVLSGFGIIVGGILILFLVFVSIKAILSKNPLISNLISVWFSIGFVHLMVSSSYLTDFKFWIYLGLSLNAIKVQNNT